MVTSHQPRAPPSDSTAGPSAGAFPPEPLPLRRLWPVKPTLTSPAVTHAVGLRFREGAPRSEPVSLLDLTLNRLPRRLGRPQRADWLIPGQNPEQGAASPDPPRFPGGVPGGRGGCGGEELPADPTQRAVMQQSVRQTRENGEATADNIPKRARFPLGTQPGNQTAQQPRQFVCRLPRLLPSLLLPCQFLKMKTEDPKHLSRPGGNQNNARQETGSSGSHRKGLDSALGRKPRLGICTCWC